MTTESPAPAGLSLCVVNVASFVDRLGAQSIALLCVPTNFVQHDQYVSCVAHTANDAVDQGLLTPKKKARFVKAAAQSNN